MQGGVSVEPAGRDPAAGGDGFPGPPVRVRGGSQPGAAERIAWWERMVTIRRHEELVERLNGQGLLRGSTHLYIGMEACAVGVVAATGPDDLALGYYRGHGHALAMGVPARRVIAEVLARVGGSCGGRGGTKHIMDVARNYYGSYAIVGQQVPIAVGLAVRARLDPDLDRIVVCLLGDGAINQGATLEALNLAAIYRAPCLFVCENNRYAVSTAIAHSTATESLVVRANGFGIEGARVDGQQVEAVWRAAAAARRYITDHGRPYFLELCTYRYRGHSVFQLDDGYRVAGELAAWKERDPVALGRLAAEAAGAEPEALDRREAEIVAGLAAAAEWAQASEPLAVVGPADMYSGPVAGLEVAAR